MLNVFWSTFTCFCAWMITAMNQMPTLLVINVIQGVPPANTHSFFLHVQFLWPKSHDRVELSECCHVVWSIIEKAERCWYWLAWNFACLKPNWSKKDKATKYYLMDRWAGPKKTGYRCENTLKKHNGRQNLHHFATFKKNEHSLVSIKPAGTECQSDLMNQLSKNSYEIIVTIEGSHSIIQCWICQNQKKTTYATTCDKFLLYELVLDSYTFQPKLLIWGMKWCYMM